jgi:benzoyl-CoA reductase/2-hydroxyglutaryl-CoA dehydratase subunit BcrC/BadD/HgdB
MSRDAFCSAAREISMRRFADSFIKVNRDMRATCTITNCANMKPTPFEAELTHRLFHPQHLCRDNQRAPAQFLSQLKHYLTKDDTAQSNNESHREELLVPDRRSRFAAVKQVFWITYRDGGTPRVKTDLGKL